MENHIGHEDLRYPIWFGQSLSSTKTWNSAVCFLSQVDASPNVQPPQCELAQTSRLSHHPRNDTNAECRIFVGAGSSRHYGTTHWWLGAGSWKGVAELEGRRAFSLSRSEVFKVWQLFGTFSLRKISESPACTTNWGLRFLLQRNSLYDGQVKAATLAEVHARNCATSQILSFKAPSSSSALQHRRPSLRFMSSFLSFGIKDRH